MINFVKETAALSLQWVQITSVAFVSVIVYNESCILLYQLREEATQMSLQEGMCPLITLSLFFFLTRTYFLSLLVLVLYAAYQIPALPCGAAAFANLLFGRLWSLWLWHSNNLQVWLYGKIPVVSCIRSSLQIKFVLVYTMHEILYFVLLKIYLWLEILIMLYVNFTPFFW